MEGNIEDISLDDIEGSYDSGGIESGLVKKCSLARAKKISSLSLNDIRILISQGMGLKYILPIAISHLEREPLIFADLYKGDLLVAVLTTPEKFWLENVDLNNRVVEIGIDIRDIYETLAEHIIPALNGYAYK